MDSRLLTFDQRLPPRSAAGGIHGMASSRGKRGPRVVCDSASGPGRWEGRTLGAHGRPVSRGGGGPVSLPGRCRSRLPLGTDVCRSRMHASAGRVVLEEGLAWTDGTRGSARGRHHPPLQVTCPWRARDPLPALAWGDTRGAGVGARGLETPERALPRRSCLSAPCIRSTRVGRCRSTSPTSSLWTTARAPSRLPVGRPARSRFRAQIRSAVQAGDPAARAGRGRVRHQGQGVRRRRHHDQLVRPSTGSTRRPRSKKRRSGWRKPSSARGRSARAR